MTTTLRRLRSCGVRVDGLPGKRNPRRFGADFINAFRLGRQFPQELKPAFLLALSGTAEAVPPIYETSLKPYFFFAGKYFFSIEATTT